MRICLECSDKYKVIKYTRGTCKVEACYICGSNKDVRKMLYVHKWDSRIKMDKIIYYEDIFEKLRRI